MQSVGQREKERERGLCFGMWEKGTEEDETFSVLWSSVQEEEEGPGGLYRTVLFCCDLCQMCGQVYGIFASFFQCRFQSHRFIVILFFSTVLSMLFFSYLFKQFLGDRLLFFFGKKTTSAYCRTDRHVDKRAKKSSTQQRMKERRHFMVARYRSKERSWRKESMGNRISRPISPNLRSKEEEKETIVVLYFSARSENIQAPFAFLNNKQNIKKN